MRYDSARDESERNLGREKYINKIVVFKVQKKVKLSP
jgi:hypothetical protein